MKWKYLLYFQLPKSQRRQIRRGRNLSKSTSIHIEGSSTSTNSKIQAAPVQVKLHSVYVGRVSKVTSEQSIRDHLNEIKVPYKNVTDVIPLNCRHPDQSSYCIIVDDPDCLNVLYTPTNWPFGVVVREYNGHTPRRIGTNNQHTTSPIHSYYPLNHRNPHTRNNYQAPSHTPQQDRSTIHGTNRSNQQYRRPSSYSERVSRNNNNPNRYYVDESHVTHHSRDNDRQGRHNNNQSQAVRRDNRANYAYANNRW